MDNTPNIFYIWRHLFMAKKNRKNASRGSVNNIILESLYSGKKYGYEIIKEIEDKTDGKIVLKQPSLYSSLTRFEEKGYVSSSWADSSIGGRRHYYELTPAGRAYYEDKVLNKRSNYSFLNDDYVYDDDADFDEDVADEQEDVEDNIVSNDYEQEYNIDTAEEDVDYHNKYNFNVQDRLAELLKDDNNEEESIVEEIEPNEVVEDEEIVDKDDDFYTTSTDKNFDEDDTIEDDMPTFDQYNDEDEEVYSIQESELEGSIHNVNDDLYDNIQQIHSNYANESQNTETIKYTGDHSRELNNIYNSIKHRDNEESNYSPIVQQQKKEESMKILYGDKDNNVNVEEGKPKYTFNESKPKYYVDENGITKQFVYNEDKPVNSKTTTVSNIEQSNLFNSSDFDEIIKKSGKQPRKTEEPKVEYADFTDQDPEEISRKNQRFQEKFDSIADSYMVKNSSKPDQSVEMKPYSMDDDVFSASNYSQSEEEEDTFVNFDDNNVADKNNEDQSYYFAYNNDKPQEEETIKVAKDVKISEYNNAGISIQNYQNNYIRINKAKFVCGIVMLLLMIVELTTMLVLFNSFLELDTGDNVVFVVAYCLTIAIGAGLIIPFFVNPNKRKLNTFKFGYNFSLGILSFFVLTTLTYAINAFVGFELANIKYFYVKLFVPIVMFVNLIIWPIVYKIISKNKRLY